MAARRAEMMAAPTGQPALKIQASPGGTVLALYAGLLILAALPFTWWRMENRAPQYGMRVLYVNVSPLAVEGDVKEIDGLGHYVGMRKLETLAVVERRVAPFLVPLAVLCALALPFLSRGRLRTALAAVVVAVPVGFVIDMWFWQHYAVTHLDPTAALNMIANRVEARLFGDYTVAQFKVHAAFGTGFWLAVVAAANVLAFLWIERRPAASATGSGGGSRRTGLVAAALIMIVGLASAQPAAADTLEVGPAAPFHTIGAALDRASPGDRLIVDAGTYREHVVINRPVRLEARGPVTLDGGGTGTVLLITAGGSEVSGFTIRGSGISLLDEDSGLKLVAAPDCRVSKNRVEDTLFGILAKNSGGAVIAGNTVIGKDIILPRRGDGIRLQNSSGCRIEENVVEQSRDLAIWNSNGNLVRRNEVRGSRYGLHYMYCDDNVFEENVFSGNQTGAAIMYSRRVTFRGNRFEGSRGPSAYGLLIKVGDDVVAERNWFLDNTAGLFLEDTPSSFRAGCTIRDNVIGGNDVGVDLQPSVARVVFTENAFVANRLQVQMLGTVLREQNSWSENGRGNYWSDYVGFDSDGNGIGDTPYRVEQFFEDLTDRWPAVGLLRMSPATLALESAARAFPVGEPRPTLTDSFPLVTPPAGLESPSTPGRQAGLGLAGGVAMLGAVAAVVGFRRFPGGAS